MRQPPSPVASVARFAAAAAAAAPAVRVLRHAAFARTSWRPRRTRSPASRASERIVIRFDVGEARLLMPDGDRVSLYQIPAASGVRYANGDMELRGKGMDLQLVRHGAAIPLADCQPYQPPK